MERIVKVNYFRKKFHYRKVLNVLLSTEYDIFTEVAIYGSLFNIM